MLWTSIPCNTGRVFLQCTQLAGARELKETNHQQEERKNRKFKPAHLNLEKLCNNQIWLSTGKPKTVSLLTWLLYTAITGNLFTIQYIIQYHRSRLWIMCSLTLNMACLLLRIWWLLEIYLNSQTYIFIFTWKHRLFLISGPNYLYIIHWQRLHSKDKHDMCSLLLIRPGPKGSNYIRSGTHQCRVSIIRMFKVDNVHSKVLLDACKICLPCPFQQRVTLVLNWVQTKQDVPDDNNRVQTKQDAPDDNNWVQTKQDAPDDNN